MLSDASKNNFHWITFAIWFISFITVINSILFKFTIPEWVLVTLLMLALIFSIIFYRTLFTASQKPIMLPTTATPHAMIISLGVAVLAAEAYWWTFRDTTLSVITGFALLIFVFIVMQLAFKDK